MEIVQTTRTSDSRDNLSQICDVTWSVNQFIYVHPKQIIYEPIMLKYFVRCNAWQITKKCMFYFVCSLQKTLLNCARAQRDCLGKLGLKMLRICKNNIYFETLEGYLVLISCGC